MTSAHDKRRNSLYDRVISPKHGKSKHNNDKISSNESVFLPKKRRTMPTEKKLELDKLFASISNDPFYENEISIHESSRNDAAQEQDEARKQQLDLENQHFFLNNANLDWLYTNPSDDDDDNDDDSMNEMTTTSSSYQLSNMASQFLDQEQREKLKEALDSTDDTDDNDVEYRFFSKRCKLPDPSITDESSSIQDPAVLPKYLYVVDKAQSGAKRKLLLSSDMLRLWYQHGWNCPHSVYQWLMEVVAFDKDLLSAKQAMKTLFSFWSNLPAMKVPLHPSMSDDVSYDRNMSIATFSHILKSYGAWKLPEIQNEDYDHNITTTTTTTTMTDDPLNDILPFIQLEWTLQLMTRSLQLWPDAYTTPQLHYLAKVLLGIGMDGLGVVVLRTLQDCFQACLLALPLKSWEHEVQTLGCSLCDEYRLVELQVRLTRAANPVCGRSTYLCRVIALASLELAHIKDMDETTTPDDDTEQQPKDTKRRGSSPISSSISSLLSSPPSLLASPIPSSATLEIVSSLMASSTSILNRMLTILQHSNSIFSQSNPDYRQLSHRIYMLDCAIGNDYAEFMTSVENVNTMVTQLRALGRRMGGRLGALDKTKANEAIQRLWSRLTYVVYQDRKGVNDGNL